MEKPYGTRKAGDTLQRNEGCICMHTTVMHPAITPIVCH